MPGVDMKLIEYSFSVEASITPRDFRSLPCAEVTTNWHYDPERASE